MQARWPRSQAAAKVRLRTQLGPRNPPIFSNSCRVTLLEAPPESTVLHWSCLRPSLVTLYAGNHIEAQTPQRLRRHPRGPAEKRGDVGCAKAQSQLRQQPAEERSLDDASPVAAGR